MKTTIKPLSHDHRTPCSVALTDANLQLANANWMKGLQSMSDWIWGSHSNPSAFPNHLARFFLQIPATFEQQLNYSATLIFDRPSYKNGIQISGFISRPLRELVISYIAQRRHCWYSMTHHAILGFLTCQSENISTEDFENKWAHVGEYDQYSYYYTALERAVLQFAEAFCGDPKSYRDEDYHQLRLLFFLDIMQNYQATSAVHDQVKSARQQQMRTKGLGVDNLPDPRSTASLSNEDNNIKVNAQIVEITFLCLQFVA
jgi:alkylhydroperoxidase family enzyme